MLTTCRVLATALGITICLLGADVGGRWEGEVHSRNSGQEHVEFQFKVDGSTLTGSITTAQGETEITDGQIDGDYIRFDIVRAVDGREIRQHYRGHVDGEVINLTLQTSENGGLEREQNFIVKKLGS